MDSFTSRVYTVTEQILEQFQPLEGVYMLQYAGELLLSEQEKKVVKEANNKPLHFLGKQSLRVLKNTSQYVEKEDKYLQLLSV